MKIKKFSVSWILFVCFIISVIYVGYSIHNKIKYFGFSINPNKTVDVWLVEARISYRTNGKPVKVSLTAPNNDKVLGEITNAEGYEIEEHDFKNKKIVTFTKDKTKNDEIERLYYKILILNDNKGIKYELESSKDMEPHNIEMPYFDESKTESAKKLLSFAKSIQTSNDYITNLILLLNGKPASSEVQTFLPLKIDQRKLYNIVKSLLAMENTPVRMIRGIRLEEGKSFQKPDLLLEAFVNGKWIAYNLENGVAGIPENFLVFQYGGDSLLDVQGAKNSRIVFSVLKNKYSTLFLSKYKAELTMHQEKFSHSMYNLPIREQNIFKIMTVFPLAILAIVILRNIIGITTLGTFTPMLIAMSFIETGLVYGMITFIFLIGIGLLIRSLFSKLNLLMVPRISSVVIMVILLMQDLTIISYNLNIKMGLTLIFFPLIITAWIIERSSILIEENGMKDTLKQNFNTLMVAALTYVVISSETIRYIMYVFNEINISILFLVMLIGTYTGYRFTELARFKPLLKKE